MKISLLLLTAIFTLSVHPAKADNHCDDAKINELLHKADTISSVEHKSKNLKSEIKDIRSQLNACEKSEKLEPGTFYQAETKLYCRSQYENSDAAVGCEEAGFDGGDLLHFKNNHENDEKDDE